MTQHLLPLPLCLPPLPLLLRRHIKNPLPVLVVIATRRIYHHHHHHKNRIYSLRRYRIVSFVIIIHPFGKKKPIAFVVPLVPLLLLLWKVRVRRYYKPHCKMRHYHGVPSHRVVHMMDPIHPYNSMLLIHPMRSFKYTFLVVVVLRVVVEVVLLRVVVHKVLLPPPPH